MKNTRPPTPGPRAGKGRPPGSLNKTTATLKEAILLAAKEVGNDGEGKDGLKGYLKHIAVTEPKAFAGLLGRVLPLQVTGEGGGALVTRIELVAGGSDSPA